MVWSVRCDVGDPPLEYLHSSSLPLLAKRAQVDADGDFEDSKDRKHAVCPLALAGGRRYMAGAGKKPPTSNRSRPQGILNAKDLRRVTRREVHRSARGPLLIGEALVADKVQIQSFGDTLAYEPNGSRAFRVLWRSRLPAEPRFMVLRKRGSEPCH